MQLIATLCCLAFGIISLVAAETPRWWKGNLHTHSLWSDGDDYPEMITAWYQQNGYHFLGISDHNTLHNSNRWINVTRNKGGVAAFEHYLQRFGPAWVEQRSEGASREVRLKQLEEYRGRFEAPGKFLLIQSEEISDRHLAAPVHLNAHNLRERIEPQGGQSVLEVMQNNINAVLQQRQRTGQPMFAHLNHPNFGWAVTAEEIMQVKGERFFEVYNGHPQVFNEGDDTHAGTERIWDIVLTRRLAELNLELLYGLATDDAHNYHGEPDGKKSRPGRGWIMVRAPHLEAASLIAALEAGDFYSSSGVELKDLHSSSKELSLVIAAEPGVTYLTEFIGTRRGYDARNEPVRTRSGEALRVTHRYSSEVGVVLASSDDLAPRYRFRGDEYYVRARVISSKAKADPGAPGEVERAWIQPVRVTKP